MWKPRHYQDEAFGKFDDGARRMFLGWHRRAGKDAFALRLAKREMEKTPGTYWHLFPVQAQARRAIWLGMDNDGVNFIEDVFPIAERTRTIDNMTTLEYAGALYQMAGSDAYNRLVGSNVRGVIFSEWALCDPTAWDYVRPILVENGGWACFITTFRGRNHAWRMSQQMAHNSRWHVDVRDITQTRRNDGAAVITLADVERERRDGMPETLIQQEFYCNPSAAAEFAYYGDGLAQALAA
jgi:hypothetical protein